MKSIRLLIVPALLVALGSGVVYSIGRGNEQPVSAPVGQESQSNQLIDLTRASDQQEVSLAVDSTLKLTAYNDTWSLDLTSYDQEVIKLVGSAERYQLSREVTGLRAGQTDLAVLLTPGCAIPRPGQYMCAMASQQITLKITVK